MSASKSKFIDEVREKPQAKLLYWDIETSPVLARVWGAYEQNTLWIEEDWHLLTFAYAWNDGPVKVLGLPDFPLYKKDPHNDLDLVKEAYRIWEEADVVLAHNGIAFDTKKIKTRYAFHGFSPNAPVVEIDTLRILKNTFSFTKNNLDYAGEFLGLGTKDETGGISLWKDIEVHQDPKAWAKMKKYNKRDVVLLRDIFKTVRPWAKGLPNMATMNDDPDACSICGDTQAGLVVRGHRQTQVMVYTQVRCNACHGYSKVRQAFKTKTTHVN